MPRCCLCNTPACYYVRLKFVIDDIEQFIGQGTQRTIEKPQIVGYSNTGFVWKWAIFCNWSWLASRKTFKQRRKILSKRLPGVGVR